MERKNMEVKAYAYDVEGSKYYIYLIPEFDKENMTGFYIEKDGHGTKQFMVACDLSKSDVSVESMIESSICEWIDSCEEEISLLDTIYDMVLEMVFKREDLRNEKVRSEEV